MRAMLVKDVGEFQLIDTLAETVAGRNATLIERLDAQGFRLLLSSDATRSCRETNPKTRGPGPTRTPHLP